MPGLRLPPACSRPYREPELLGAVRATLTLLDGRARAEARAASMKHLERVPGDALMLP